MPDNADRYQIVFLIDVSLALTERNNENDLLKTLNVVRTSALKLLSCLASSSTTTSTPSSPQIHNEVQWGYKFYNSRSPGVQAAKYGFRDLSLKTLEEFENELENRLEKEQDQLCHPSPSNDSKHGTATGTGRDSPVSGMAFGSEEWEEESVDKLKRCLMDVVHDFTWDRPMISSPVKQGPKLKGRRRMPLAEHEDDSNKQHNLVFLYSRCPQTLKELQGFCDRAADVNSVLTSFLPGSLQRQWCDTLQLKLYWLDTSCIPFTLAPPKSDFTGVEMMHSSLQVVSGGVIPVAAFLQPAGLTTTHVYHWLRLPQPGQTPSGEDASPKTSSSINTAQAGLGLNACHSGQQSGNSGCAPLLFPVRSLVSYYLCHNRMRTTTQHLTTGLLLHYEGGQSKIISHVQLQPLFMPADRSVHHPSTKRATRSTVTESATTLRCDLHTSEPQNPAESSPLCTTTLEVQGDSHKVQSETACLSLVIRGTLPASAMPLSTYESGSAYMVVPSSEEGTATALSELLVELARQQVVLVCDRVDSLTATPALSVLRPLTSVCGTLTLVRSELSFLLEKLLCFACDDQTADLDSFVRLHAGAAIRMFKPLVPLPETGPAANYLEDSNLAKFSYGYLEKWYKPEATAGANADLIASLSDSPSPSKAVEKEAGFLKKMQKSYMRAKSQRLSVTLPNYTSTRRSPTIGKRTPRKNPKTPNKRTPKTPKRCPKTPRATSKTPKKSLSQLHRERKTPRKVNSKMTPRKGLRGGKTPRKSGVQGRVVAAGLSRVAKAHGRSSSLPDNRGREILQRSRQALANKKDSRVDDKEPAVPEAKTAQVSQKPELPDLDIDKEDALLTHIQEIYDKTVAEEGGLMSAASFMYLCALSFFKKRDVDSNPEVAAATWMEKNIAKDPNQLRDKYKSIGTEATKEQKCQEYQLQVLLHMDLAVHTLPPPQQPKKAAADEDGEESEEDEVVDAKVQQLVTILRGMSFLKNPTFLSSFLNTTLLHRYLPTCPHLLGKMYEELLQPLPPVLEDLLTPGADQDIGSVQPPDSNMSVAPGSNISSLNPPSSDRVLRDRKLIRHPTFDGVPHRQIAVTFPKPQAQGSKRRKTSGKKTKEENAEPEVKAVRRNLFTSTGGRSGVKLERRQSVAVMELHTRGHKTPTKQSGGSALLKKPKTPKSHHILKTKSVTETPAHKQKQNQVWRRQEKERRRTHTVADVEVVAESPDKCLRGIQTRKSPRRGSLQFGRRSSFYSEAPSSKSRAVENMEHMHLLEARMKGQRLLSPTWKEKQMLSQMSNVTPSRRIHPKSLFSSIVQPSPDKAGSSTISPEKLSAWAMQAQFDSPSRNTRKRALFMSPERSAVADVENTPPDVRCSPRLQSKNVMIPSTPVNQVLQQLRGVTPGKARRSLAEKLQDNEPAASPSKRTMSDLTSPRRVTRMQTTLLSPSNSQGRSNPVFTPPIKEDLTVAKPETPGSSTAVPGPDPSPKRLTRLQTTLLSPTSTPGYVNPAFAPPIKSQISGSPAASSANRASTSTQVEEVLVSPRRSKRLQSPTNVHNTSPGSHKQQSEVGEHALSTTNTETGSTQHTQREEVALLSPRRSGRLLAKSPTDSGKVEQASSSMCSSAGEGVVAVPLAHDELRRKARSAHRQGSVTSNDPGSSQSSRTFSSSQSLNSSVAAQQSVKPPASLRRMSSKRKLGSDCEPHSSNEDLNHTPQKRRCTVGSSVSSVSSLSQNLAYFDSPEVFAREPTNSQLSLFASRAQPRRNLPRKGASLESNSESNLEYPVELGAIHEEDSNSSATFPGFLQKHLQRTISDMTDIGSDSEISQIHSPTFSSPAHAAMNACTSPKDNMVPQSCSTSNTPPQHKLQGDRSPVDFKNFSPNISHRSLKQLIQSPLVSGGKKFAKPKNALDILDSCDSDSSMSPKRSWKLERSQSNLASDPVESNDSEDSQSPQKRSWKSERSEGNCRSRRSLYS